MGDITPPLPQDYHVNEAASMSAALIITAVIFVIALILIIIAIVLGVKQKSKRDKQNDEVKNNSPVESLEQTSAHLTAEEWKLIADFRALGAPGKQLVKTTIETLLDSSYDQQS